MSHFENISTPFCSYSKELKEVQIRLLSCVFQIFPRPETLAEGRSKIRDAKTHKVVSSYVFLCPINESHQMRKVAVVTKEFLTGVKTEGLVTMIRQHLISEWGAEGSEEKVIRLLLGLPPLRNPIILVR